MVESLLFIGAAAEAGEKKNPEQVKNEPAPQRSFVLVLLLVINFQRTYTELEITYLIVWSRNHLERPFFACSWSS